MSFLKSVNKAFKDVAKAVNKVDDFVGDVKNSNISQAVLDAASALTGGTVNNTTNAVNSSAGTSSGGLLSSDGILGSLLGGIGNVASSLFNGMSGLGSALVTGLGDYFSAKEQWKYNKQAMELQDAYNRQAERRQYNYNLAMMSHEDAYNQAAENRAMQNNIQLWNMQNEYNTPAAQMQRLSDAGLNPNLAYGTANTTAGGISAPSSHGVSGHGVTTRATKALVRQAMALNYQQIQSNQLQNMMMAEQIADKRANRALALEQYPVDMAYKQAQIEAIKQGYGLRVQDIGLKHAEIRAAQDERHEQNLWRRYQDDLDAWDRRRKNMPFGKTLEYAWPSFYNKYVGRRPMWMDYMN